MKLVAHRVVVTVAYLFVFGTPSWAQRIHTKSAAHTKEPTKTAAAAKSSNHKATGSSKSKGDAGSALTPDAPVYTDLTQTPTSNPSLDSMNNLSVSQATRWEYKWVRALEPDMGVMELQRAGQEGWEAVGVAMQAHGSIVLLKRPLASGQRAK